MIATAIVDYCREFAETIKQIDFKELISTMIDFVKQCNSIFKALGGLKTVAIAVGAIFASKLLTSIFGIVSAIGTVAKAMWALNAVLWANPVILIVGAIVAAIALLCYGVYKLYENWNAVCDWFSNLWNGICDAFWKAVEWVKDVFGGYWSAIAKGITWYWETVKPSTVLYGMVSVPTLSGLGELSKKLQTLFAKFHKQSHQLLTA